jgi:hypothetical protein
MFQTDSNFARGSCPGGKYQYLHSLNSRALELYETVRQQDYCLSY